MTMPEVSLEIKNGLTPDVEGYATQQELLDFFQRAIRLQQGKARIYGEAFRSQGYMGNMARVLSKVARLRNMVWTDIEKRPPEETLEDTLLDLINLAGFMLINLTERNKWGNG